MIVYCVGVEQDVVVLDDGVGMNVVVFVFLLWNGFVGQYGFIKLCFVLGNFVIYWYVIVGSELQQYFWLNVCQWDVFFVVFCYDVCGGWGEIE